jgi:putative flippase GtrA
MTSPSIFIVWLRFNGAGLLGVVVQLAVLHLLTDIVGMHFLLATILAVESALMHNFVWHECFTWRESLEQDRMGVRGRLLRFHLSNGLISIIGNLLLMDWLVERLSVPPLPANFVAICVCSTLNFFSGHWFVFRAHAKL